jgi:hypothetical protein
MIPFEMPSQLSLDEVLELYQEHTAQTVSLYSLPTLYIILIIDR